MLRRLFLGTTSSAAAAMAATAAAPVAAAAAPPPGTEAATFAGGCFWCVEYPFSDLKGVHSATSGYIGGHVPSPTYEAVCSGDTGHAEAVRVVYDPAAVSYATLLDVFFSLHDPTTLNRQGNDVGTQYRSAIFTHSPEQLAAAKAKISALEASGKLRGPVVTQLADAAAHTWYVAEGYHQGYCKLNPGQGYVRAVSLPKAAKVKKEYPTLFR